jgi:hypothetical protein
MTTTAVAAVSEATTSAPTSVAVSGDAAVQRRAKERVIPTPVLITLVLVQTAWFALIAFGLYVVAGMF